MHVNKLPHLVLARVFDWACNNYDESTTRHFRNEVWRSKLELLAVCRKWRCCALPRVHKISYIRCVGVRENNWHRLGKDSYCISEEEFSELELDFGFSDTSDGSDDDQMRIADDSSYNRDASSIYGRSNDSYESIRHWMERAFTKSNLDIIGDRGKSWPKHLQIYIKTYNDPDHILRYLMKKVNQCKHFLPSVRRVELCFCMDSQNHNIFNNDLSHITGIDHMGYEFSRLTPSVQFLKFRGSDRESVAIIFARAVAAGYADQLEGISYPLIAAENVEAFSDKLKYAKLFGYEYASNRLPQICTGNLTVLDLEPTNLGIDLGALEVGKYGTLNFPNLKTLRFGASVPSSTDQPMWDYTYDTFKYEIIAPKLVNVAVEKCIFAHSLLTMMQEPRVINSLTIVLNVGTIHFTQFDINTSSNFLTRCTESGYYANYIDSYDYLDYMLNIPCLAEHAKMSLEPKFQWVEGENMCWKYLHDLKIDFSVHVGKLKRLVSGLHSLETIHIKELDMDGYKNRYNATELEEDAVVKPIVTKLKTFSFSEYAGTCTKSTERKIDLYLRKLFPGAHIMKSIAIAF